ncbi:MAG: hypothetical protein C4523_10635 [Myxococcales bacterium]|nr:MAG: hypothetical protein C4523_10635 [Myxococcales bacterium]
MTAAEVGNVVLHEIARQLGGHASRNFIALDEGGIELDEHAIGEAVLTHLRAQRKASDVDEGLAEVASRIENYFLLASCGRRDGKSPLELVYDELVTLAATGAPPQTCAAGSVPELLRELMDATNRLAFFGASVDASDGNGYNVKPIWRAMLRAFARERGIELDGKEKAASPSPPVIESGKGGLTYQHYRTPDEVARRWKHALDLHREHVEHLFAEYDKGIISLDQVKHRAMMLVSPISDQDLRLATDEAVGIAEELHRESQTVGGEKTDV